MSSPLDINTIAKLLKEEAEQPSVRTRGPKVDPTADRSLSAWQKQQHHLCTPDCPHRIDPNNPTWDKQEGHVGNACWNPNCEDHTRNKETDRGTNIVVEVKGQFICRYCYLAGYLQ
jgi:hypothetical protein